MMCHMHKNERTIEFLDLFFWYKAFPENLSAVKGCVFIKITAWEKDTQNKKVLSFKTERLNLRKSLDSHAICQK